MNEKRLTELAELLNVPVNIHKGTSSSSCFATASTMHSSEALHFASGDEAFYGAYLPGWVIFHDQTRRVFTTLREDNLEAFQYGMTDEAQGRELAMRVGLFNIPKDRLELARALKEKRDAENQAFRSAEERAERTKWLEEAKKVPLDAEAVAEALRAAYDEGYENGRD